jgi:cyanate lyase
MYKELSREKLVKYMIKSIKEQNLSFKNIIRNYGRNVIEIRDKILSKANVDINDWINEEIDNNKMEEIVKLINSYLLE